MDTRRGLGDLQGRFFIGGIVEYFADLSGGLHKRKKISFWVDKRDHHLSSICFVCRRTQAIIGCANGCQRRHQDVIVHLLGMRLAKNGVLAMVAVPRWLDKQGG